jgi:hydrogenase maturation protease
VSVLVAGVGNLFFRDDAFGIEVARQLAAEPPPGARVVDIGIRTLHLAFELLEPCGLCIIVDCMARGAAPGTLFVVEPEPDAAAPPPDAHGMDLAIVFSTVRELGGQMPRTLVVGCEPAVLDPGIGLSTVVASSVNGAIELVRELISRHQELP